MKLKLVALQDISTRRRLLYPVFIRMKTHRHARIAFTRRIERRSTTVNRQSTLSVPS